MRWISWITFVVGVWLIAAPFALGYSGMFQATASDVIVGMLIAASSLWMAVKADNPAAGRILRWKWDVRP